MNSFNPDDYIYVFKKTNPIISSMSGLPSDYDYELTPNDMSIAINHIKEWYMFYGDLKLFSQTIYQPDVNFRRAKCLDGTLQWFLSTWYWYHKGLYNMFNNSIDLSSIDKTLSLINLLKDKGPLSEDDNVIHLDNIYKEMVIASAVVKQKILNY